MNVHLYNLLIGKSVEVSTGAGVDVVLEIKDIKGNRTVKDLEPANEHNDWWPRQEIKNSYLVTFVNGYTKEYNDLESIKIL